ncbi:hypothetical protein E4U21_004785 [Claviceps maximensis]|nr:hypothetical protein E4U21_004785 [Claviceps maximensis]
MGDKRHEGTKCYTTKSYTTGIDQRKIYSDTARVRVTFVFDYSGEYLKYEPVARRWSGRHAPYLLPDLAKKLVSASCAVSTPPAQRLSSYIPAASEYKIDQTTQSLPHPWRRQGNRSTTTTASPPHFIVSMASLAPSTAVTSGTHLQVPGASSSRPVRPKFNSHLTSDRLREGAGLYLPPLFKSPRGNIRKDRVSVFKELGLDDHTASYNPH